VNDELGYLVEETSRQNVEGTARCLLTAYSKMLENRNELQMESMQKKNLLLGSISAVEKLFLKSAS
jgi:hypothetical protein